jgi:hypothetical protein
MTTHRHTLVLSLLALLLPACGGPQQGAASSNDTAGGAAALDGAWVYDSEGTIARCEALPGHDCRDWAQLADGDRDAARAELTAEYQSGAMQGVAFDVAAGTLVATGPDGSTRSGGMRLVSANGNRITLALDREPGMDPEEITFELIDASHVCIVEDAETSDQLCFRRAD